jgi:putative acetyltransferase
MGMRKLRTGAISDAEAITAVHDRAFNNKGEGKLVCLLRESEAFVSDLSIVAEQDGEVIGHVLFTKIALVEDGRDLNCLSLAPVAVAPKYQRQGVGKDLIEEGIRRAKSLGFSSILVLGDPKYYGRFGFEHRLASAVSCKYQCEHFQGLELRPNSLAAMKSASATYPAAFTAVD